MSLADSLLPLLPLFPSKKNLRRPSLARPFEESLILRLKSLLPLASESQQSIPISWIARAADVLSLTLSDAELVLSDPEVSESEAGKNTLGSYLDSSVKLLDAANSATAEIDRVLRRRLHLRLAFHHLSNGDAGKARSSLAEWDRSSSSKSSDLVGELAPRDLPGGKISTVARVIYAVNCLSYLVASTIAAALAGETVDLLGIRVSTEFPWAEMFNRVVAAVSGRKGLDELEALETAVRRLTAAVDVVGGSDRLGKISAAANAAELVTEQMTEKLDRLSGAVERMFRAGLSARNAALQCFRFGPKKCK